MSSRPNQSSSAPGGPWPVAVARAVESLGEDVVVDWVEGELPEARARELAGRFPEAFAYVSALRRDRIEVSRLGVDDCPMEIGERVSQALEREALFALSNGVGVGEQIRTSSVVVKSDGWLASRFGKKASQRLAPALAVAAGLVLLVGAGALWSRMLGGTPGSTQGVGPLALTEPSPAPVTPSEYGSTLAMNEATTGASALPGSTDAEAAKALTVAAGDSGEIEPTQEVGDDASALALAREGKLLIRVRVGGSAGMSRVDALAEAGKSRLFRLSADLDAEAAPMVLALAAPPATHALDHVAGERAEVDLVVGSAAGEEPSSRSFGRRGAPRGFAGLSRSVVPYDIGEELTPKAYVASLEPDAGALRALRVAIENVPGARVEFVRLDDAGEKAHTLGEALGESLVPTPDEILWWANAPAAWTRRVGVPMVVQSR